MKSVRVGWLATLAVLGLLFGGLDRSSAEETVTREEFQKLLKQFDQFRTENAKLKSDNAKLKKDVEALKGSKHAPIMNSRIRDILFQGDDDDEGEGAPALGLDTVRSGDTKFTFGGYGTALFQDKPDENSTFIASFNPIFLWKFSDRLSFNAELEFEIEGQDQEINLEFSHVNYHFHDYFTLQAGKILTPFGIFMPKLHPTWINKLATRPYIYRKPKLLATSILGVNATGAFKAGPTQFNYNVYVSNGDSLNTGASNFGTPNVNALEDQNQNKTVGGRIGFLPIPELEIGASGMYGKVGFHGKTDSAGNPPPAPGAVLNGGDVDQWKAGIDLNFVRDFKPLMGTVDIKGEWMWVHTGNARFLNRGARLLNGGPLTVDNFKKNTRQGGWIQFAYRPSLFSQRWVKNLEAVVRVDYIDNPHVTPNQANLAGQAIVGSDGRTDRTRFSVGVNYYLESNSILRFTYEDNNRGEDATFLQWATAF